MVQRIRQRASPVMPWSAADETVVVLDKPGDEPRALKLVEQPPWQRDSRVGDRVTPPPPEPFSLGLAEGSLRNLDEADFGVPEPVVVDAPQLLRDVVAEEELTDVAGTGLVDVVEIEADRQQLLAHVFHRRLDGAAHKERDGGY